MTSLTKDDLELSVQLLRYPTYNRTLTLFFGKKGVAWDLDYHSFVQSICRTALHSITLYKTPVIIVSLRTIGRVGVV